MNVLITGGAGYIGSSLLGELAGKKYNTFVYDRFDSGSAAINNFIGKRTHFIKGDIRDKSKLKEVLKHADVVVHLAGIVGFPACDSNPYEATSVNVDGTRILCDLLSHHQKLIFASTGSTYGIVKDLCTEKTPINPLTLYGRNKAEGEIIVRDCGGISLRLATLFGVAGKCRNDLLINNLMRDAIKNRCITLFQGNVMRTFLEVSEAARCFRIAIDGGLDSGETYNVGDENYNFTKLQVAEKICKLTNAHLFTNDYNSDPDGRDYKVSYEKIKIKGFSSVLSINDVLSNLKSYYEVN